MNYNFSSGSFERSFSKGRIERKEDYYMFYNDHGIADLVLDIVRPVRQDNDVFFGSLKIKHPAKPSELNHYIKIKTLSGRSLRCYLITAYINKYDVSYVDIEE